MKRHSLMLQGVFDGDYRISSIFIYRDPSGVISIARYQYLGLLNKYQYMGLRKNTDMSLGFYLGDRA